MNGLVLVTGIKTNRILKVIKIVLKNELLNFFINLRKKFPENLSSKKWKTKKNKIRPIKRNIMEKLPKLFDNDELKSLIWFPLKPSIIDQ